jgi:two-component system phosphate regulon sensor histidine kinase PhoR
MMFSMPNHWREELGIFLGIVLTAGLAGALTGRLPACLLLGLLVYLGWHLYQLARLARLLSQKEPAGPGPAGLWKDIVRKIQEQRDSNHARDLELTHELERYRNAVNTLPDAVVILESSGRVSWCNPSAANLLNIVWPDSQGRLLTVLAPDPVLAEYLAGGNYATPLTITSPANKAKILSMYIAPLKHETSRLMVVARDITREYYLDESRRDFVANVSHELRTPLTVISGLAEQLHTDIPDPAILPRSIELILQQARRMSELVSDLLTLSRLEMQPTSAPDEPVPVAEILTDIVEEARALSSTTQHVLRQEICSPEGLRGNTRELHIAFSNLVTNAIRHTPNQSEVTIKWLVNSEGAHLSVTDTGEGIAARHIPRLTERLYRVDASHSRDTGGTGLGLAIVERVLEAHEAELEIISNTGGGSTFTCHFPTDRVITL